MTLVRRRNLRNVYKFTKGRRVNDSVSIAASRIATIIDTLLHYPVCPMKAMKAGSCGMCMVIGIFVDQDSNPRSSKRLKGSDLASGKS